MPDLSIKASHEFWEQYNDPTIYKVIAFMEGVEEWTLDGDETLEQAMSRLAAKLDHVSNMGEDDKFIQVAAYIKTSRTLRLLQALDTARPGAASKLLIHAEESSQSHDDVPGLFLRRNIIFERLRLLSRVFSPERIALVIKAIEGEDE